jgi:hypothetical protein
MAVPHAQALKSQYDQLDVTVTTPREDQGRLVDGDALKLELQVTSSDQDAYYEDALLRASEAIESPGPQEKFNDEDTA